LKTIITTEILEAEHFKMDYTFFLNIAFLLITGILVYLSLVKGKEISLNKEMAMKSPLFERVLKWLAIVSFAWLVIGILMYLFK